MPRQTRALRHANLSTAGAAAAAEPQAGDALVLAKVQGENRAGGVGGSRIGREVIEAAERFAAGVAPREAVEALWLEFATAHNRSQRKLGREDPLEPIRYLFPSYEPEVSMLLAAKARA